VPLQISKIKDLSLNQDFQKQAINS